jgi:hypothetical protein
MPNNRFSYPPIGIAGAARSGKDTLCRALIREFAKINTDAVRKSIAGDAVKTDLKDVLMDKFSLNSFTENNEEKEFMRPLLVEYGKMQRNRTKGRYFIDGFEPVSNVINILPDIRYVEYPEDEVYWLKNEVKGLLIFVERKGVYDANDTEKVNNTIIKNLADYHVKWASLDEQSLEQREMINWYAKLIIDQYYLPLIDGYHLLTGQLEAFK